MGMPESSAMQSRQSVLGAQYLVILSHQKRQHCRPVSKPDDAVEFAMQSL